MESLRYAAVPLWAGSPVFYFLHSKYYRVVIHKLNPMQCSR